MSAHVRWRESRYGLRGVRVGEASNPGPDSHRSADVMPTAADSDSEGAPEAFAEYRRENSILAASPPGAPAAQVPTTPAIPPTALDEEDVAAGAEVARGIDVDGGAPAPMMVEDDAGMWGRSPLSARPDAAPAADEEALFAELFGTPVPGQADRAAAAEHLVDRALELDDADGGQPRRPAGAGIEDGLKAVSAQGPLGPWFKRDPSPAAFAPTSQAHAGRTARERPPHVPHRGRGVAGKGHGVSGGARR